MAGAASPAAGTDRGLCVCRLSSKGKEEGQHSGGCSRGACATSLSPGTHWVRKLLTLSSFSFTLPKEKPWELHPGCDPVKDLRITFEPSLSLFTLPHSLVLILTVDGFFNLYQKEPFIQKSDHATLLPKIYPAGGHSKQHPESYRDRPGPT